MAVDVKVIGVYLCRFTVLFAGLCFRFGQKHPCISATLLSFLFLYVFFPLLFRLLIYSSPVIFCAYAYRKSFTNPEARIPRKYHQDKNRVLNRALLESESDVFGKAENDSKKKNKGIGEDEYEDDDDEDGQEDVPKAVEWTEQDERNLMELGTSETERDKRLESLIQKRRARKLLSMQVRNVIDIIRHPPNQVAPLVIARSTGPLNLINTLSDTDDLHMPGSAPSVLLPSRSPFDLPYDPFEERPDLTGDGSFEQEFVTADQKDFCRHESFFYGGHSGTRQDANSLNSFMNADNMRTERQRFSRFRSYIDRGSYESISPGASEHELMTCGEQQTSKQPVTSESATSKDNMKPVSSKTDLCEGNPEPDPNRNPSSEDLSSYLHKSLAFSIQETAAKGAKENGGPLYTSSKDMFNVHKRILHTPAHSIASDLVVEVSEAGSPPTLSPPDEDSSHYDGDIDRDLSSGSEDLSMHVYKMEEHGTRSSEGQVSIPEVVELEEEVVDEYEHASHTSSDDNSSYENVVHHLTDKLNARRVNNNVIVGTPEVQEPCNTAEMDSGLQIENLISSQTNPMSGAAAATDQHETLEPDGNSSKQANRTTEEERLYLEEEGSSNTQVTEDVRGSTEVSTSGDATMVDEQQDQANEEVTEVTSPKSVLPETDFRDQMTRLDSQPSDMTDNVSDVTQLENSTSSTPDNQSSRQMEIPNARSSPSETSSQQEHNNEGLVPVGETSNLELIKDAHGTVSSNNQAESLEALSSAEALPLSNTLNSDDEFNGMSAENLDPGSKGGSSAAEPTILQDPLVSIVQTPAEILDDTSNSDSQNEAPLPDMDTELHIHHITETCM